MTSRFGLFVTADAAKCTGCKACELACFQVHNAGRNHVGRTVGTIAVPVTPKLYVTVIPQASLPIQCKHCENAPCRAVCRRSAIAKVGDQVVVDEARCIGCKDCLVACPFGAITLLPYYSGGRPVLQPGSSEVLVAASKCDLCHAEPQGPACVRVCPNKALAVNDLDGQRKAKNIAAAEALALINDGAPERRAL